jgi:TrmH family RNA methyltransferase
MPDGKKEGDMIVINSTQNETYKKLVRLQEKKERTQTGLFLIEGYREILRASEGEIQALQLFICPEFFLGSNEKELIRFYEKRQLPVTQLAPRLFEKLSFRDRPDGMLLLAKQFNTEIEALEALLKKTSNPFLLIAEAIEKPGNLGSILRSCDAAGVDAVIVCDECTDIYNPNVIRSSVGTLFTVPIFEMSSQEAIALLKKQKIHIAAATPSAQAVYTQVDFQRPVAIAVGTEQLGLSKLWMEQADLQVKIPMLGKADSLNVSNATTLLLYEVVRQRS